jgi:hypothetical protein
MGLENEPKCGDNNIALGWIRRFALPYVFLPYRLLQKPLASEIELWWKHGNGYTWFFQVRRFGLRA